MIQTAEANLEPDSLDTSESKASATFPITPPQPRLIQLLPTFIVDEPIALACAPHIQLEHDCVLFTGGLQHTCQ
jgi:hypothetical protein